MARFSYADRLKLAAFVPALLLAIGAAGMSGCARRPPAVVAAKPAGAEIRALRPGQLRVCTLAFHSPLELAEIKSHLPANRFEFSDLTPALANHGADAMPPPSSATSALARSRPGWLIDRCRPDLRCDILIYSGEFAGGFFGEQGISVTLQEMEEASCLPQCKGLFRDPREVFLLGCNTLATKSADARTPEEYLRVLLEHDFSRADAERAVELRYGPLGPSFRESLRRIFTGVPRVYGFSTVAPRAEVTAPRLRRYFRGQGDYAQYLERTGRDSSPNTELLASFKGTGLIQTSGLTPTETAAADRASVCKLYDETQTVEQRLRIVQQMFTRQDFLTFVPTVEVFLRRHPPEQFAGGERRAFADIQALAAPRRELVELTQRLSVSALKLQMATLSRQLGWITAGDYDQLATAAVQQLLSEPLSTDVADIGCELSRQAPAGTRLRSEEIPEQLFWHPEGYRWLDCLSPADARVSARMLTGLENIDESTRLWAVYALSRRLPLDDAVQTGLARGLGDSSAGVRERVRSIFEAEVPLSPEVLAAIRERDPALAKTLAERTETASTSASRKSGSGARSSPDRRMQGRRPSR